MPASTMTASTPDEMLPLQRQALEFVFDSARRTISECDKFLDAQRALFLKQPTFRELAEHRLALAIIMRAARAWQNCVFDPDFPDHSIARQLEVRLRQLEESWSLFYNPMPQAEADAILESAFPNEC